MERSRSKNTLNYKLLKEPYLTIERVPSRTLPFRFMGQIAKNIISVRVKLIVSGISTSEIGLILKFWLMISLVTVGLALG